MRKIRHSGSHLASPLPSLAPQTRSLPSSPPPRVPSPTPPCKVMYSATPPASRHCRPSSTLTHLHFLVYYFFLLLLRDILGYCWSYKDGWRSVQRVSGQKIIRLPLPYVTTTTNKLLSPRNHLQDTNWGVTCLQTSSQVHLRRYISFISCISHTTTE